MKVTLNGTARETEAATVAELLDQLGMGRQAVAVEINRELVPKRQHAATTLHDGDVIEMVTLVGGG